MPMPIDPSLALGGLGGAEWQIAGAPPIGAGGVAEGATKGVAGGSFGDMLSSSMSSLAGAQTQAAQASQAFASGQVTDPTEVVMSVERARLSMQMASQIRTKGVEAFQDIFHTQV